MSILPQLLINALITGSIYALVSFGLSMIYCTFGTLNFAHGHLLMLGAYLFYSFFIGMEFSALESSGLTLLLAIPIAVFILAVFIKPFLNGNKLLSLVTTLALSIMIESIISLVYGVNVKTLSKGAPQSPIILMGIYITRGQVIIILTTLVVLSFIAFIIHRSPLGRRVRALFESHDYAQAIGIDSDGVGTVIMGIGVALAFLSGIFLGFETNLQPTMGSTVVMKGFASMILGGLGNLWGALLGSYLLSLIEHLSIGLDLGPLTIPAGYKDGFAFLVILLVLLFRPHGLFVKKKRGV